MYDSAMLTFAPTSGSASSKAGFRIKINQNDYELMQNKLKSLDQKSSVYKALELDYTAYCVALLLHEMGHIKNHEFRTKDEWEHKTPPEFMEGESGRAVEMWCFPGKITLRDNGTVGWYSWVNWHVDNDLTKWTRKDWLQPRLRFSRTAWNPVKYANRKKDTDEKEKGNERDRGGTDKADSLGEFIADDVDFKTEIRVTTAKLDELIVDVTVTCEHDTEVPVITADLSQRDFCFSVAKEGKPMGLKNAEWSCNGAKKVLKNSDKLSFQRRLVYPVAMLKSRPDLQTFVLKGVGKYTVSVFHNSKILASAQTDITD